MPYYMLEYPDGSRVGRMHIWDPLGPVRPAFAATYDTRAEAESLRPAFPGTRVVSSEDARS